MIIVSNTTPLSELAKVGQLDLLQKLFGKIIIPQEVYNEVTTVNHREASVVPAAQYNQHFQLNSALYEINFLFTCCTEFRPCYW